MKSIFATLSVGLLLTGCATKAPEQLALAPEMEVKVEKPSKTVSRPFSERIHVGAVCDVESNDGYRKVQVSVKNLTGGTIKAIYRFLWYDSKGIEVSAPNQDMWHSLLVIGGEELVLSATAPTKDCPDVKLLIKEALKQ